MPICYSDTIGEKTGDGGNANIRKVFGLERFFNRWTGNIEQNPYTLTVTEDLDLEAEFESTL